MLELSYCINQFLCITKERDFIKNFVINLTLSTIVLLIISHLIYQQHKLLVTDLLEPSKGVAILILLISSSTAMAISKIAHNYTGCKRYSLLGITNSLVALIINSIAFFSCIACMLFFLSFFSFFLSFMMTLNDYFYLAAGIALITNILTIYFSCTKLIGKVDCNKF
ncbi:MAG: hypothetical protein N3E37_04090 [Candidatus Micrarchaeota archaeon]|nr:hypothetical protein [Candidatus Micrarchaeota archaeon]